MTAPHDLDGVSLEFDAEALEALSLAYGALPCLMKLLAAALLYLLWIRPEKDDA